MKNSTLAKWLMGTLIAAIVIFFISEDLGGLILLTNWVFVFIAGVKLTNIKDKQS